MKRKTLYSQGYNVYYRHGSMFGATINGWTRKELDEMRDKLTATFKRDTSVEGVRWAEIWETSSVNCGGCRSMRFVKKVTNRYW